MLDTLVLMTSHKTAQTMKPATAAKKLRVPRGHPRRVPGGCRLAHRAQHTAGRSARVAPGTATQRPAPRPVVAAKLGISISGLARGGITEALTTEQIEALKTEAPDWLRQERATQAEVRKEAVRIKEKNAAREDRSGDPRS